MAKLNAIETKIALQLFESGGYVLDFSNSTFEAFFQTEVGTNIYDDAYAHYGGSKGKRLRTFLERGQPAAIAKALTALWGYRSTMYRLSGETDKDAELGPELSAMIVRLGGQPLALAAQKPKAPAHIQPSRDEFGALNSSFREIMQLDPHPRGYAFEKFLKRLFDAFGLEAREAFKLVGEQIDGSFQLGEATVLLEAKWQNTRVELQPLQGFQGRVEDRPIWTRGLFVSYSGFSDEARQRFMARRVILMDGFDLHEVLSRELSLRQVITQKSRKASETGQAYVPVRDLTSA
jgi:hypothetical protein